MAAKRRRRPRHQLESTENQKRTAQIAAAKIHSSFKKFPNPPIYDRANNPTARSDQRGGGGTTEIEVASWRAYLGRAYPVSFSTQRDASQSPVQLRRAAATRGLFHPGRSARVYAVGDIHGRLDLLDRCCHDRRRRPRTGAARSELIFLGDLVDRGPDSKGVVERLLAMHRAASRSAS
jgi:hypothetical protein